MVETVLVTVTWTRSVVATMMAMAMRYSDQRIYFSRRVPWSSDSMMRVFLLRC